MCLIVFLLEYKSFKCSVLGTAPLSQSKDPRKNNSNTVFSTTFSIFSKLLHIRLEALLEGLRGPELHAAALILLPLPLPLLRSLRGEELRHVAVVDDVDGGGQDVEDEVVEVDVDAGPLGLLVLAEVHVYGCKEKCSVAAV